MSLVISPVRNNYINNASAKSYPVNFGSKKTEDETTTENPISRKGEVANLIKITFLGGFALGMRLLWELLDGDFLFEHAGNTATKIVDKNNAGLKGAKRDMYRAGATVALIAAGVSAFALLYTMLNAPKIAYKSKVNAFKKEKEMDVYVKANEAEKGIYTELSEKATNADDIENAKLKEQYMQMRMAKNEVPEFAKSKKYTDYK